MADKESIFLWEGTDKQGNRVTGESAGTNPNLIKAELRRQGVIPAKVKRKPKPLFSPKKKAITTRDISIFARQLATMVSAGLPLVQSLDIVARGHENPSMQELLLIVRSDVEGGTPLSEALRKHPKQFDELFCNLIFAGEQAGVLESLLHKVAEYKEKTEALRGKVKKALFYPTAVFSIAMIVTGILLIFVVPQFESLFSGFGADLPIFTQIVINASEWLQEWWWLVIGLIGLAGYAFTRARKTSEEFNMKVDAFLLKLPVVGDILVKTAYSRFARTLATMFTAGVPLVEALESVSGATGNAIYSQAVLRIREDVATGSQIRPAMQKTGLFPNLMLQMVAVGEESGALDSMLSKAADFYEEEVNNSVDSLSTLLEPLIMAVLGTIVGGLVVSMYLPIFEMGSAI